MKKSNRVKIIDYLAYTDGSCVNTSPRHEGGSAYIFVERDNIVYESSKGFLNTTSNRMELLAIISAVNHIPLGKSVMIRSDSQYSIKVLSGEWSAQENLDLIDLYKKISDGKEVLFEWVKGHNGDKFNEYVDNLARTRCGEM